MLDLGICRHVGKGQSELGLLRTLLGAFLPGDVVLGDRLLCAWTEMALLKQRGVDCVCRFTSHRTAEFRRDHPNQQLRFPSDEDLPLSCVAWYL